MMKHVVVLVAIALMTIVPGAVADSGAAEVAGEINCTGTPTGIPAIYVWYQFACNSVVQLCDSIFSTCPI